MRKLSRSRCLRAGELAERLGISRVTLWRWERSGRLPPKRQIGPNVVGWLESEIDEWFARTTSSEEEDTGEPDADGSTADLTAPSP